MSAPERPAGDARPPLSREGMTRLASTLEAVRLLGLAQPAPSLLRTHASGADPNRLSSYCTRIPDFALAQLLFRPASETSTHLLAGTPPYMAPEQARGTRRDLTARCDVHALAAVLYE